MPREIQSLADSILHDPLKVEVAPVASTAETVAQSLYLVAKGDKPALLAHLLGDQALKRALVFTRTKHGADKVVRHLGQGGINAEAIHGNKSQNARVRALENFRKGTTRVLVASDIAARGLDIDEISHVVNYDLPNEPETYVHRIGRTGRAGASGIALSFCDGEERAFLRDIERLIRKPVPVVAEHPFAAGANRPAPPRAPDQGRGGQGGHGGGFRHGGGRGGQGGGRGNGGGRGQSAPRGGRAAQGEGQRAAGGGERSAGGGGAAHGGQERRRNPTRW